MNMIEEAIFTTAFSFLVFVIANLPMLLRIGYKHRQGAIISQMFDIHTLSRFVFSLQRHFNELLSHLMSNWIFEVASLKCGHQIF
jgi:hypothetical protein